MLRKIEILIVRKPPVWYEEGVIYRRRAGFINRLACKDQNAGGPENDPLSFAKNYTKQEKWFSHGI